MVRGNFSSYDGKRLEKIESETNFSTNKNAHKCIKITNKENSEHVRRLLCNRLADVIADIFLSTFQTFPKIVFVIFTHFCACVFSFFEKWVSDSIFSGPFLSHDKKYLRPLKYPIKQWTSLYFPQHSPGDVLPFFSLSSPDSFRTSSAAVSDILASLVRSVCVS